MVDVAEELLDVLAMHALYEQQRVTQVCRRSEHLRSKGKEPLENRFEGAGGEMLSVHRFPTFVGKREIVFLPNLGQEV